jgi:hypothetical protein
MTNDLLVKVWDRLEAPLRKKLTAIIQFHHPEFDPTRATTFPELEPLLSSMEANRELFHHTRKATGNFRPKDIQEVTEGLLWHVAQWFEIIHEGVRTGPNTWVQKFAKAVRQDRSTIISFNWDLVLDELLLEEVRSPSQYGFEGSGEGPILLKPHGSLNWFDEKQAGRLKDSFKIPLATSGKHATYAFTRFRSPKSKKGNRYQPLIVPPHYMKRFDRPGFKEVWNACVSKLSTAREVIFIGYSLPPSDFHARFMLRCAFHNTTDGVIVAPRQRGKPVGPPSVTVVNPDQTSARRIESATTPNASFKWRPSTAQDWVQEETFGG